MSISEGFLLKSLLVGLVALPCYLVNPYVPVIVLLGLMMKAILEVYFPTEGVYVNYRLYGNNFLSIVRQLDALLFMVLNGLNLMGMAVLVALNPALSFGMVFPQTGFFNGVMVWILIYTQTLAVYSFYTGRPEVLRSVWVLLSGVLVMCLGYLFWLWVGFEQVGRCLILGLALLSLWYVLPMQLAARMNKINGGL
ncbi:hypothetical protein [Lunatimonas sp.]|uniref:hypothetical protein n=1 Tax=Lunatimonas sp. TaxID=2060141 RepID=UPI00263B071E|nr:hypothetical protein [Lunatimonas sp.]